MMKKLFPLLLAAACFTASAQIEVDFSQGEDVAWVTYCNDTMDFSDEESQPFWKQHKAMKLQVSDLKKKKRVKEASLLNPFIASGQVVVTTIEDIADLKVEMVSLERDFMLFLVELLGSKRAIEFNLAEREYKRQLKLHRRKAS